MLSRKQSCQDPWLRRNGQSSFAWGIVGYMTKLPEEVREAASVFGRMGGKAAGRKMTKEARIARAKKAAQARWEKLRRQTKGPYGSRN